jgi:hypothetical protein
MPAINKFRPKSDKARRAWILLRRTRELSSLYYGFNPRLQDPEGQGLFKLVFDLVVEDLQDFRAILSTKEFDPELFFKYFQTYPDQKLVFLTGCNNEHVLSYIEKYCNYLNAMTKPIYCDIKNFKVIKEIIDHLYFVLNNHEALNRENKIDMGGMLILLLFYFENKLTSKEDSDYYCAMIEKLIDAQPDPNFILPDNNTGLHWSLTNRNTEAIARTLIQRHARVTVRDMHGKTALTLAAKNMRHLSSNAYDFFEFALKATPDLQLDDLTEALFAAVYAANGGAILAISMRLQDTESWDMWQVVDLLFVNHVLSPNAMEGVLAYLAAMKLSIEEVLDHVLNLHGEQQAHRILYNLLYMREGFEIEKTQYQSIFYFLARNPQSCRSLAESFNNLPTRLNEDYMPPIVHYTQHNKSTYTHFTFSLEDMIAKSAHETSPLSEAVENTNAAFFVFILEIMASGIIVSEKLKADISAAIISMVDKNPEALVTINKYLQNYLASLWTPFKSSYYEYNLSAQIQEQLKKLPQKPDVIIAAPNDHVQIKGIFWGFNICRADDDYEVLATSNTMQDNVPSSISRYRGRYDMSGAY